MTKRNRERTKRHAEGRHGAFPFGWRLLTALILFSFALTGMPSASFAAAPLIAVVDVQKIMQESLAAQGVKKKLEAQRVKFQSEIEREENDLRQAEQTLTKERASVSPQTYVDHEQQLRQRFAAVETHVQARRKTLDKSYADTMALVRTAILGIVAEVAHNHGAMLVVTQQEILWADPHLDMTDEVLKRLDQNLPKIEVVAPVDAE